MADSPYTIFPTCEITDGTPPSYGIAWTCAARIDNPRNITPSNDPMMIKVSRAFFHAGGRNAGTPLEIASTPVTAAPPEPNAFSAMKTEAPSNKPVPWWVPSGTIPGASDGPFGRLPRNNRYAP